MPGRNRRVRVRECRWYEYTRSRGGIKAKCMLSFLHMNYVFVHGSVCVCPKLPVSNVRVWNWSGRMRINYSDGSRC